MQTLKKSAVVFAGVCVAIAMLPSQVFADQSSDIHIMPNESFSAKNLIVKQKSGTSNFFTRANWPSTFVRVTVLSHDETVVTKEHGEASVSNDIQEGDLIDVEGMVTPGDSTIIINATKIVDHALLQQSSTLNGLVISVDTTKGTFVLSNKTYGSTIVMVPGGVSIQKGARSIGSGELKSGDKILSVSGTYDFASKTLTASSVSVYQDPTIFISKNFEGVLKSVSGTTLPATLTVTVGTADYSVYLPANAPVMKTNRSATSLARFQMGDKVRFYGAIRKTDLTAIDATLVRDINF